MNGTTAEDVLLQLRVWPVTFTTPKDGLASRAGKIDAVVYDRPLLAWSVKQDFQSSIQMLDTIFDFQNYAFAVPLNSPLRKRSASPCSTRRKAHGGARRFFATPARGDECARLVMRGANAGVHRQLFRCLDGPDCVRIGPSGGGMRRRDFLKAIAATPAWPCTALAQNSGRTPLIG